MEKNQNKLKHDNFVKAVFSDMRMVRELLEDYAPKMLLEKIDLSTIKPEKDTFIGKELKHNLSDLVFLVKLKSTENVMLNNVIAKA